MTQSTSTAISAVLTLPNANWFDPTHDEMATRGRPPRKRSPNAGADVKVKGHIRSPRGPNYAKPNVVVAGYKRGDPNKVARRSRRKTKRA